MRELIIFREYRWQKDVFGKVLPPPNDQTVLWENREHTDFQKKIVRSLWGSVYENTGEIFKTMDN